MIQDRLDKQAYQGNNVCAHALEDVRNHHADTHMPSLQPWKCQNREGSGGELILSGDIEDVHPRS